MAAILLIILTLSSIGIAKRFFGVIFNPFVIGLILIYGFICSLLEYWYLIVLLIVLIVSFILYRRSKKRKFILNVELHDFITHKGAPWMIECLKCHQKILVNYGSNICESCGLEIVFALRVQINDKDSIVLYEPLKSFRK